METHNADPSAPSGYYSIHAANGSAVQVYCHMEGTKGGLCQHVTASATCPQGLDERNFTEATLCGRINNEFWIIGVGTTVPGAPMAAPLFGQKVNMIP